MATMTSSSTKPQRSVVVHSFTNGVLDPETEMLGPVEDGGTIIVNTAPGCWGPMITPSLRGGHEVTRPVYVEGAEPGDGIAIRIRDITVTSAATSSGHDSSPEGYCLGDPYVAARCPTCDAVWPETHLEGIGQDAVICNICGNPVKPFEIVHGHTVVFDDARTVGVTVPQEAANTIARNAHHYAALPGRVRAAPDPGVRPGRSRRRDDPHAPIPRPARDHAIPPDAGFPQRR
jgi:formamidase